MNKDRLIVIREAGTITVSLRPDWRGMNAHSLGHWVYPLNAEARDRLIQLGVDPADVEALA